MKLKAGVLSFLILFLVAIYVLVARVALAILPLYTADIQLYLTDSLKHDIVIKSIESHWKGLDPLVDINGLTVNGSHNAYVGRVRVQLSFLNSLLALSPRLKLINLEQLELSMTQSVDGLWSIASYPLQSNSIIDSSEESPVATNSYLSFFESMLDGTTINLIDSNFSIHSKNKHVQTLKSPYVGLHYKDDKIYASGHVLEEEGDSVLINFSLVGDGVLSGMPISGTLYSEARSAEFFGRLLNVYNWEQLVIENVEASTRSWLSFEGFEIKAIQGDLQLSTLDWRAGQASLPPLTNLAFSYNWTKEQDSTDLSISDFGFNWAGQPCYSGDIFVQHLSQLDLIQIESIDVNCVGRLALASGLLSQDLSSRIEISNPEGVLENIELFLYSNTEQDDKGVNKFDFNAELKQVSLEAYGGSPLVKGIDGYLHADSAGGDIYFDSENFELGFPTLFSNTWEMKHAEGAISWRINEDDVDVFSEGLRLWQTDESLVYGDFILRLNPKDSEDYLALSIGMQDIAFVNATDFVPSLVIGEDLHRWLGEALLEGKVTEGIYYGYGSIEDKSPLNSFTSSIYLKSEQGQLKFAKDWPPLDSLDAEIFLQNDQLLVEASQAQIHGTELHQLQAKLPAFIPGETHSINIAAQILENEQALSYWLTESPIAENTKAVAEQIQLEGDLDVSLSLDVPVSSPDDKAEVSYQINTKFENLEIMHLSSNLLFEKTQGSLSVSSNDGLVANDINTLLFGEMANLTIASYLNTHEQVTKKDDLNKGEFLGTVLSLEGAADIGKIFNFFGSTETFEMSGGIKYSAQLSLPENKNSYPRVDIHSNLEGLLRNWPAPLSKSPSQLENLDLNLLLKPNQIYLTAKHQPINAPSLDAELLFVNENFSFGEILLGGERVQNTNIDGLNIAAKLDTIELMPWVNFIQNNSDKSLGNNAALKNDTLVEGALETATLTENSTVLDDSTSIEGSSESSEPDASILKKLQLNVVDLQAFGQNFNNTKVILDQESERWRAVVLGDSVEGEILLPTKNNDLDIRLNKLLISSTNKTASKVKNTVSEKLDPRVFPAAYLSCQELFIDEHSYGAWNTFMKPYENGVRLTGLSGKINGSEINGQLNWQYFEETNHNSILTLEVKGGKIENLLSTFKFSPLLTSESFTSTLALVWPDEPLEFKLGKMSGSFDLAINNGFLKTDDETTGILRLFGVLNAETITRRLRLDFSDLYKSGVGFDSVGMGASIDQGLLTITDPLSIKGPSGDYVINGRSDLEQQTLDLDMLVELPFAQNVPLAALVLGAPQIGGIVWVVDKLLGEPLSALTTSRYDISGTWDEPIVELDQAMNASKKDRSKEKGIRGDMQ